MAKWTIAGYDETFHQGSGLSLGEDKIHVQVSSGLFLTDDNFGVDWTAVQASGNYLTTVVAGGLYEASGTVDSHESALDPHPGYLTPAEGNTLYDPAGAAAALTHDGFADFVGNEHIDHTGVDLTAGSGLAGGGTIAASRRFDIGQGTGITVGADDISFDTVFGDGRYQLSGVVPGLTALAGSGLVSDGSSMHIGAGNGLTLGDDTLVVDFTAVQASGNYLTKEQAALEYEVSGEVENHEANFPHISTARDLTAGSGLTGGGDLSADRRFDIGAGTGITVGDDDIQVDFTQVEASGAAAALTHDGFADFVADEHIDHTTVSIAAGSGLTGGGTIAADREIHVGIGSGLYLQDDLIGFSTSWGDQRYALSGEFTATAHAGSGLYSVGDTVHLAVGSGLYLQDDLVGVDLAALETANDLLYLRLDATNDPITGDLEVQASGTFGGIGNTVALGSEGIEFAGTARPWMEIPVSPTAIRVGGDKVPAFGDFVGSLKTYLFEDGNDVQQVYFEIQLPQGVDSDTPLIPHVHYAPAATSANPVGFFLEYAIADPGEVYAGTTTVSGFQVAGTADEHEVVTLGSIDISSAGENAMLMCRLYRDPTDGGDTFGDDAAFLQFNVHHKLDRLGSTTSLVE